LVSSIIQSKTVGDVIGSTSSSVSRQDERLTGASQTLQTSGGTGVLDTRGDDSGNRLAGSIRVKEVITSTGQTLLTILVVISAVSNSSWVLNTEVLSIGVVSRVAV
jgi:hypothetical protein